jgi:hypothetical protein
MNWTTVPAAFGAITGAAGLSWQVLNYRLTGGLVQVSSMYFKQDDLLQVLTDVINVGRLSPSSDTMCGPTFPINDLANCDGDWRPFDVLDFRALAALS